MDWCPHAGLPWRVQEVTVLPPDGMCAFLYSNTWDRDSNMCAFLYSNTWDRDSNVCAFLYSNTWDRDNVCAFPCLAQGSRSLSLCRQGNGPQPKVCGLCREWMC